MKGSEWFSHSFVSPNGEWLTDERFNHFIPHSPIPHPSAVMPTIEDIAEGLEPQAASAGGGDEQQLQVPESLPVLPLRDIVIYPFMIVPLFVSREKSIRAVDEALGENRMILLVSQKDLDKEEPAGEDLSKVGTVSVIMRMLKLPDGRIRILVQGLARARVEEIADTGEFLRARLAAMAEPSAPERSLEVEALVR